MPPASPIAISVLICTHRGPGSLDFLFDSLEDQSWTQDDEIILVDNGVEPLRGEEIKLRLDRLERRGVRSFCVKEERVGLTHARLKGFGFIHNHWAFLLDDDNSLEVDCLLRLRETIQAHPELGGICPRIEPLWEKPVPRWTIALGHDVLSYNTSSLYEPSWASKTWGPGVRGKRPPGGGMIICKTAIEGFIALCQSDAVTLQLGHRGSTLGSGEDILLYSQLYGQRFHTAYENSIRLYHRIPLTRTSFSYICRLFFFANKDFGLIALILKGKILFPASIAHSVYRLGSRLIFAFRLAPSWQVVGAAAAAFAGYLFGTCIGVVQPGLKKIKPPHRSS